jgi:hypothetical protein
LRAIGGKDVADLSSPNHYVIEEVDLRRPSKFQGARNLLKLELSWAKR